MSNNILDIFDSNEVESISALIDRLEKSSFDYLKLESGEMSIVIGKNGAGEASPVNVTSVRRDAAAQTPEAPAGAPAGCAATVLKPSAAGAAAEPDLSTAGAAAAQDLSTAGMAAAPDLSAAGTAAAPGPSTAGAAGIGSSPSVIEEEGVYIIKSPSYGIFYAQSEPGIPPYVTVGAEINADDTIGLMEIMKTFTAITSPVAGEVTAIHVKNEETLEPGQPLVSVKVS